jgi:hypothetical protein
LSAGAGDAGMDHLPSGKEGIASPNIIADIAHDHQCIR